MVSAWHSGRRWRLGCVIAAPFSAAFTNTFSLSRFGRQIQARYRVQVVQVAHGLDHSVALRTGEGEKALDGDRHHEAHHCWLVDWMQYV